MDFYLDFKNGYIELRPVGEENYGQKNKKKRKKKSRSNTKSNNKGK